MDSINPQASGSHSLGQLGVRLYRFRGLVKRNWWVLALTIGIGLAWQGWSLSQKPHLFESTSQLMIREAVSAGGDATKFEQAPDAFIASSLSLLKSAVVLNLADAKMRLEAPELVGDRPEIVPAQVGHGYLFNVVGQGKDPVYTRRYVDACVASFIQFRLGIRDASWTSVNSNIGDELKRLNTQLDGEQAKFQEFIKANNMEFWNDQAVHAAEYLSGLKTRQAALQTDLRRLEQLTPDQLLNAPAMQAVPRAPGGAAPNDAAAPMGNDLYSIYIQRSQDLAQAQARYDERARFWKPKHPRLQDLRGQVEEIQRSLDLLKKQNAEACAQRKDAIRAELKSLEESIAVWDKKILEASGKDAEYKQLESDINRTKVSIEKVRSSSEEEGRLSKNIDVFNIIQPATVATPVPFGLVKQLLTGLIGGAVAGIAFLLLLDRADDRMTSSTEMMAQFTEPILGQIPDVMESRGASGLPLLQLEDERYTFAEAFRSLRSSLIFMPNQEELRTVLVTSAIPNEGKSTIASNLAITMAAAGANIVLVDADLRRGDLASLFDTDGRTGLSNVLRGEVKWEDAAQSTRYPLAHAHPAGPGHQPVERAPPASFGGQAARGAEGEIRPHRFQHRADPRHR